MAAYGRVILKVSGESLRGADGTPVSAESAAWLAGEVRGATAAGAEVGVVIGGGNIIRGAVAAGDGSDRVTADGMGMLGTVINALALRLALEKQGQRAVVMTARPMSAVAELFDARRARDLLANGTVVMFAGGTGNPYFSTDTAAALRAAEVGAHALLKGTKADGVYDADPATHPDAKRFDEIAFLEVIERRLGVMDMTAFSLCRDIGVPIVVFDLFQDGNIRRVVQGETIGTLVKEV